MEHGMGVGAPGTREIDGVDPSGALTVTIDATHRVVSVRVSESVDIRTPDALARTFAAAYSAALSAKHENARQDRPRREPGQRPKPVATLPTFQRPTREQLTRHRIREESRFSPRASAVPAIGISSNECVQVSLAPAQPVGALTADAGWLANASLDNLARAISEAHQNAYAVRDQS